MDWIAETDDELALGRGGQAFDVEAAGIFWREARCSFELELGEARIVEQIEQKAGVITANGFQFHAICPVDNVCGEEAQAALAIFGVAIPTVRSDPVDAIAKPRGSLQLEQKGGVQSGYWFQF